MTLDQDFGSALATFLLFVVPLVVAWVVAQWRHRNRDERPVRYDDRRNRPSGKAF